MESAALRDAPPHLGALFPALRLPWLPLGSFPTRVERLELPGFEGRPLYVKRDDSSGPLYGGNKVRKLELLLAHARHRGKKRVVTVGAFGSHHALATTIYGRREGLDVDLVLYPQPLTHHVLDDLILDHACGAGLIRSRHAFPAVIRALRERSRSPGDTFFVPPGGSSTLGTLGHVEGGLELVAQVKRGELPEPETVVVAFGTGGTAAGLALGLALGGLRTRVLAVRVVEALIASRALLRHLVRSAKRLLVRRGARRSPWREPTIDLDPGELGVGYGHPTRAAHEASATFARAGLTLETTYTGKAAAAFLRLARERPGRPLLFWNTFSSVDLGPRLAQARPSELPGEFHPALAAMGRLDPA